MKNYIKKNIVNLAGVYDMKTRGLSLAFLITIIGLFFTGCVEITAERFDEENKCWGSPEVVDEHVSVGFGGSSSGAVTIAKGPSGEYWRFASTSLPDGYSKVSDNELSEAPLCE